MQDQDRNEFINSDERLREQAGRVKEMRDSAGLTGLTGGLEAVRIVTEIGKRDAAVEELLRYTGLGFVEAFEGDGFSTVRLSVKDSADFLVSYRTAGENPFLAVNDWPKSHHLPNTRLECFVYSCRDLRAYEAIQRERGVAFQGGIRETDGYLYLETMPSAFTGNSLGFIEFKDGRKFAHGGTTPLLLSFCKPEFPYLANIGRLDHTATRVKAQERDAAVLEFMELTSYNFEFAIFVESLNSITSVARLTLGDYAQVFTSGIKPFVSIEESGPTEKFIVNYGTRVHHMAFSTENIDETFKAIKDDGMEFLVELVGSPEDGLKQTFTVASENTLLVNEYIHRYGDFDGFFTRSNVTELTRATERQ